MALCKRLVRVPVAGAAVPRKAFASFSARTSLPSASGSVSRSGVGATRHFTPSASVHHSFPPLQPDSIPRQESPAELLKRPLEEREWRQFDREDHIRGLGKLKEASVNSHGRINLVYHHKHHDSSRPHELRAAWLRDACQCSACVSESSGQKKFSTVDIPDTPTVETCRILEDGALEVVWANDFLHAAEDGPTGTHTSVYSSEFLRRILTVSQLHMRAAAVEPVLWDWATYATEEPEAKSISYDDWMAGGPAYANAVVALARWGLICIKGMPDTKAAVQEVAEKMGHLQSTFYGPTWDVISKPNAENAAYTNEFLCLHQDLLYYSDSPKIQLLHCLRNDCQGGDSLFSDGLRAAFDLLAHAPSDYEALARSRLLYQYHRNGNHYRLHRPVIEPVPAPPAVGHSGPLRVNWAPPFQGPLPQLFKLQRVEDKRAKAQQQRYKRQKEEQEEEQGGEPHQQNSLEPALIGEALDIWHGAARRFRDNIEAPQNMLQYRLQPGDCVVFDNARVLHGRTRFDTASGHRHLHGTYLSEQVFDSALTRLVAEGAVDPTVFGWPKWRRDYKNFRLNVKRSSPPGAPASGIAETHRATGREGEGRCWRAVVV